MNHGYGEHSDDWQMGGWVQGIARKGEEIKKYKLVATEKPQRCQVQCRKWSSQTTYTHDPWT